MEIQKIFSEVNTDERLYSILMSEEEMRLYAALTQYDMTDQYKAMKDSDILAEKKKSNLGTYVKSAKAGGIGAALGAGAGAILGATKFGKGLGVASGAKLGAAVGGAAGLGGGLLATHGQREQNRFANKRLGEMKRQALRRESKDWKNNAVNRDGYTS